MRRTLAVTICCLAGASLSWGDTPLQQAAAARWRDQVYTLRTWVAGNEIQIDDQGKLLYGGKSVAWTVSRFQVQRVSVGRDKIELRGNRIGLLYDNSRHDLVNVRLAPLTVVVRIDTAKLQPNDVDRLTSVLFITETAQLAAILPDSWKAYVTGRIKAQDDGKGRQHYYLPDEPNARRGAAPKLEPIGAAASGEEIFRITDEITPPVGLKTPDPSYDEFARSLRVQGQTVLAVVVGADGSVRDAQIARPLGMGLDDRAIEAVRGWRFRPATKDGKPVTVQINVEVNFRLY